MDYTRGNHAAERLINLAMRLGLNPYIPEDLVVPLLEQVTPIACSDLSVIEYEKRVQNVINTTLARSRH